MKYYTLAAEANHPQAIYNLGLVYLEGSCGVPKDHKLGLEMLQQAATHGLVEAQRYLGVFYTNEGQDSFERAVYYFKLAAKQKDSDSQFYLGLCYEEIEETCKAAHYYKLAADQDHEEAQYRLALFHLQGLGGLPVNTSSGTELLQAAAKQGHTEATVDLHRLQGKPELQTGTHIDRAELTPFVKLSTSVSSPSLTELVRNSFSTLQELSSPGSLSQLFRELMLPGYSGRPVPPPDRPVDGKDDDSDSGVIFTLGYKDTEVGTSSGNIDDDVEDDVDEWMGNICRTPLGSRRNYTMPDLHIVSCF